MPFCFQDPTSGLQRGLVLLLLHPLFDTGLSFPAGESWWRLSPGPGPGFLDHHVSSWTISASYIESLRTLTPICPVSGWIYLSRAALIIRTKTFWEKLLTWSRLHAEEIVWAEIGGWIKVQDASLGNKVCSIGTELNYWSIADPIANVWQ